MDKVKKDEPKTEAVEAKQMYRYFCDACTGVAFVTSIVAAGESKKCRVCGKAMVTKKENFIKI